MYTLQFSIRPLTTFATPLAGDTLFGQLCWAIRERHGEPKLSELLEGYTEGHPFLVVSDAFPRGFVPRPVAPDFALGRVVDSSQRKAARTFRWLPVDGAGLPLALWLEQLAACDSGMPFVFTQNTINRLTGTTGENQFAPRQVDRTGFAKDAVLDVYVALDETRLSTDSLERLIEDVGLHGYGRDATTGSGKFVVLSRHAKTWPARPSCHWLTLAPCAPDVHALDAEGCFYLPVTRFGRHGNVAVMLGAPFKRPVLMAATGALLRSKEPVSWDFHGRGLGGRDKPLSTVIPATVHQGYAPVIPLLMEPSA